MEEKPSFLFDENESNKRKEYSRKVNEIYRLGKVDQEIEIKARFGNQGSIYNKYMKPVMDMLPADVINRAHQVNENISSVLKNTIRTDEARRTIEAIGKNFVGEVYQAASKQIENARDTLKDLEKMYKATRETDSNNVKYQRTEKKYETMDNDELKTLAYSVDSDAIGFLPEDDINFIRSELIKRNEKQALKIFNDSVNRKKLNEPWRFSSEHGLKAHNMEKIQMLNQYGYITGKDDKGRMFRVNVSDLIDFSGKMHH